MKTIKNRNTCCAEIEIALIAALAHADADRDLYIITRDVGTERFFKSKEANKAWQHFGPTGEFDWPSFTCNEPETATLLHCRDPYATSYHIGQWVAALRTAYQRRVLKSALEDAADMEPEEAFLRLAQARRKIAEAEPRMSRTGEAQDLLREINDLIAGRAPEFFVDWGIDGFNQKLGGIGMQELVVIGGRPGIGKSALLLQIALAQRATQRRVGYFSFEMTYRELMHRCTAQKTGLDKRMLGTCSPEIAAKY